MKSQSIWTCFALSSVLLFSEESFASEYDDCIMNNMKGVTSDVAAKEIKNACYSKNKSNEESSRQKENDAKKKSDAVKYEESFIDKNLVEKDKYIRVISSSASSQVVKNKTEDKTITYLKLSATNCARTDARIYVRNEYAYIVKLTPGSSMSLVFPNNDDKICTDVVSVRARQSKWNDFSISGSIEPVDKDPF